MYIAHWNIVIQMVPDGARGRRSELLTNTFDNEQTNTRMSSSPRRTVLNADESLAHYILLTVHPKVC